MVEFGYFFFVKNTMQGRRPRGRPRGDRLRRDIHFRRITTAVGKAPCPRRASANTARYTFTVTDTTTSTTITTDAGLAAVSSGDALQVSVQATWSTIGAGFRPMNLIGGSKIVVGTAVMRHE